MIIKDNIKNILITRTDRLGDVILTLPLVTETKRVFKNARVFFLVKNILKAIIYDYDGIDELLIEEEADTFSKKYKLFKSKNLDLVINVKPRFDLALIFFLLGVKYRIGTAYRWYSFLYNYKVREHRKISDKHESDYNLNLLKNFFDEVNLQKEFHFKYSAAEKNSLDKKLEKFKFSLKDNFIIIHPGSGGSAKDLPMEKFSEYINCFFKEYPGYKIVMTGLAEESGLIETILKNVDACYKENIIDLSGHLSLRELLILTDNSCLFISNSTGPIHIAGALNKNIIGFYPNEKPMSDTRWKPLGSNVRIIKPKVNSDNMNDIKVREIISATKNVLN